MHSMGYFSKSGPPIPDGRPFLLATVYRSVYGIVGNFITAKLAPARPMFHALVGGAIGFVLALIGVIASRYMGPEYGPHWYPIALAITALPCAWLGGKFGEVSARRAR
jgi:hypothetical protein